jgi:NAD(P)-dependent dehydrogenase (short-subunit alcohol dehydrogenase family)
MVRAQGDYACYRFPSLKRRGKMQLAARSKRHMSVMKLFDLTGKVALITGGSRGLGLQMGTALGEMGAKLAITARKRDELEQAHKQLGGLGIEALPLPCDLQNAAAIDPMVEAALAHYGRIDILVNNAGATWGAPAEDHPLEAWQKLVNLNLTATFLVSQAVGKRWMIPNRQGHIVVIASIAGLGGSLPEHMKTIAYNTTKGGLVNFTRARRGVGAVRHHGECDRARVLPVEDDAGNARQDGRCARGASPAPAARLRRGSEGTRRTACIRGLQAHHGTDHCSGRRSLRRRLA